MKLIRKIFIFPIRFYQNYISRYTAAKCKFYPTCSNYAIEAIEKHGVLYGSALAIWRILRCNPFSKGGIDYVPEKKFCFKKEKK